MMTKTNLLAIPVFFLATIQATLAESLKSEVKLDVHWDSAPAEKGGALAGFAEVVRTAAPSVVAILIELPDQALSGSGWGQGGTDLLLRPAIAADVEFETDAIGSGVILSSDGYILTSSHVVESATRIRVLVSGSEAAQEAQLIGIDSLSDIAVIKIEAKGLPVAKLAKSSELSVGDLVLTIGNPFGLEHTVTSGIVSALGRNNLIGNPFENLIQTDAPINPGSSGGALVDNRGRVVGITSAMIADGGRGAGVGFAEPIESAVEVARTLVAKGAVKRGYVGAQFTALNRGLAGVFGVDSTDGAVIAEVASSSPAERAGLEPADVLVRFDSIAIKSPNHLEKLIAQAESGKDVALELIRYGESIRTKLTVGTTPSKNAGGRAEVELAGDLILDGVILAELDPGARIYFGVPADVSGVVVVEVDPASPAGRAGMDEGDVILQIGREKIGSLGQALTAREKVDGGKILLRVLGWQGIKFTLFEEEID